MALDNLSASIDKNPVTAKESIVLTVIADDDVNNNALDTSVLLNDFIVGRTSVSSQTSIINFTATRSTSWTTVLIPKRSGKIIIPSLTIEGKSTQPITLNVLTATDPLATKQQDIFISSEISTAEVYVQQMVTLSVKLHFSTELQRGSLSEPILEGANVEQIGKDKESNEIINGRRYRVIERLYAINPQQSGEYVIRSPRFSGEVAVSSPSNRRSNFFNRQETKPISIIGDDIPFTVNPIPPSYQGHWLPSELLTLHQEWQPDSTSFMVGEPITRTITLTAAGLSKEQLPKITVQVPDGLKVYPDQAERHSNMTNERIVSQQVQSFAIVASTAGTFELPAITISWWNTVTNKIEQAVLPAQRIVIQPNTDLAITDEKYSLPNTAVDINSVESPNSTELKLPSQVYIEQNNYLQWLFLTLWLLTSLAWLTSAVIKKRQKNQSKSNIKNNAQTINGAYLSLLAACKKHQATQVLSLIIPWIKTLKGAPETLSTLDEATHFINKKEFSEEINLLQKYLYGKDETNLSHQQNNWDSSALLMQIQIINKKPLQYSANTLLNINP